MRRLFRRARAEIGRFTGRVPRVRPDLRVDRLRLGTTYGGWVIAPSVLRDGAVVYSAGVGADVSFDRALLEGWDLRALRLIDPTPGILEHPRVAELVAGSRAVSLHPVALDGSCGTIRLWPPPKEDHVSFSGVHVTRREPIEVPALTPDALMAERGDDRIDLLKMDIEGAEYAVIDRLLDSGVVPSQLLVEFHHRFPGVGAERTEATIARLRSSGFRLFAVSETGEEYSFLHESAVA